MDSPFLPSRWSRREVGLSVVLSVLDLGLVPCGFALVFIVGCALWLGRDGSPDLRVGIVQAEDGCT